MSEEDFQEEHHEHHLPKRNLWQRWTAWSGSFLVISVLLHVILLGGATMLVVQVVQNRKEKMKFTAPPPSANASAEHKVKPSKKTAAAAPAISKRITSSAANASIALPSMDLNSTGPDVMASVMSGMGASGLGSGAGGGAVGMASMPLAGLTAFGFKGGGPGGLIGHIFDLKQTKDRKPTEVTDDGIFRDRSLETKDEHYGQWLERLSKMMHDPSKQNEISQGILNEAKVVNDFFGRGWDPAVLERFYQSPDSMTAYQIAIPGASQQSALEAFGVDKEMKKNHLLIHYKGTVTAPRDGEFRFVVRIDNGTLAIRFDGVNVLGSVTPLIRPDFFRVEKEIKPTYLGIGERGSLWFHVQAGRKYPMEILMTIGGLRPGEDGGFSCTLQMEEKHPPTPYLPSEFQWQSKQGLQYQKGDSLKHPNIYYRYPLFVLKKGLPTPEFKIPNCDIPAFMNEPKNAGPLEGFKFNGPFPRFPDLAPEPLLFPGSTK